MRLANARLSRTISIALPNGKAKKVHALYGMTPASFITNHHGTMKIEKANRKYFMGCTLCAW